MVNSFSEITLDDTLFSKLTQLWLNLNPNRPWHLRAIWLKSEQYKLLGKSDLIEAESGQLYPVECKRGRKGEWDNDELQVCAQALCLEEMTGEPVNTGYIYSGSRPGEVRFQSY